ncbi:MAG TPA: trehalase family glycosidase, partial [Bryobacteraceae bacterium]|nr:trehalase family glycosidase [Bryobacteraceae bacterium]
MIFLPLPAVAAAPPPAQPLLSPPTFRHYVEEFNRDDNELYRQAVPNSDAWDWMQRNVPFFECPDKELELTYYFRWWTYRKHLRRTPVGFVVTEFLPNVPWAGKFNTISCALGHHFYEGRWIADPQYLDDYARFWFRKDGGEPRRYSCWIADALLARDRVHPNPGLLVELLPDLVANFEAWEKERRDPNGLFWQIDDRDGMEVSVGGSGYRATLNSYMFGDATAIAVMARRAGRIELGERFDREAAQIKRLVQEKLWDNQAGFFKVLPRGTNATLVNV